MVSETGTDYIRIFAGGPMAINKTDSVFAKYANATLPKRTALTGWRDARETITDELIDKNHDATGNHARPDVPSGLGHHGLPGRSLLGIENRVLGVTGWRLADRPAWKGGGDAEVAKAGKRRAISGPGICPACAHWRNRPARPALPGTRVPDGPLPGPNV